MMLFEAFSPFPALVYFSGRTSRERSCPIHRVPSRLGFWAPSSQPLLPPDCRPSSETCLIHKFGLRDVPKQLGVSHPYCVGGSSCHRRWPSLGAHVVPPSTPRPCARPAQELLPGEQTPQLRSQEPGSRSRVLPAWWCVLSCKLPLFSY